MSLDDDVFHFDLHDDAFLNVPQSQIPPILALNVSQKPLNDPLFKFTSQPPTPIPESPSSASDEDISVDRIKARELGSRFVFKTQEEVVSKSMEETFVNDIDTANGRRLSKIVELRDFRDDVEKAKNSEKHVAEELINNQNESVDKKKLGTDDFELLKVIGRGAYGKVFLVKQRQTSDVFAMKVLKKASIVVHAKTTEHTKNERQILSKIAHPFIVKLHYAFQTPSRLYLILGYAQGGELFTYMRKEKMFTEDIARFYIGELFLALEHLHDLGIIYRDLKPENVLLDNDGHILLTDFGLSKVALDGTQTVCGTAEFMAPEVIEERTYDRCVDYWSLGVMLYDMLNGTPPFTGGNRKKVLENILRKKPVFPRHFTNSSRDICTRLLKKNPAVRLGSDSTGGVRNIKNHSFFKGVDWDALERRECVPPILPVISDGEDTSNFDQEFTSLPVTLDDDIKGQLEPEVFEKKKKKPLVESSVSLLGSAVSAACPAPTSLLVLKPDSKVTLSEHSKIVNMEPMEIRKKRISSGLLSDGTPNTNHSDAFVGFSYVASSSWIESEDIR
ncbi:serine/threonine protein kinase psk1 [Nowakowskiella sp. JEL0078]|nr:serine/threonine protein kinase psk1 [Nowakowskiella sp. JEL0078]